MIRLIPLLALLAACASPDRAFWGAAPVEQVIGGRRYIVYTGTDVPRPRVQVIRMGYARRAEQPAIVEAMQQAAVRATGCALVEGSARGDSSVMTARLACD
ncbi:MAG: hypothetical protein H6898_17445 [Rhodobacter sp.]|nr:hypothetical protein [Paracoccaceae bacterium]MCC0078343.1 hypothetical protein [Rhodobacter sp.]